MIIIIIVIVIILLIVTVTVTITIIVIVIVIGIVIIIGLVIVIVIVTVTVALIVTVTVTGGLYPLKYLWENIGSNPAVTATASTNSSTRFTANVACSSSETTTFRCKITDLSGAIIYSDEVTVTLTNNGTCPGG